MALTIENALVDAHRDERFAVDCRGIHRDDCVRYGDAEDVCTGCPAWESLKARVASRVTAGDEPAVLTRRSESAP